MIHDVTLDRRLRDLDAAPADLTVDRDRQARLLAAVLATDPDVEVAPPPHLTRRPRRTRRRVILVAAAAAVAATAVVLPATTGGQPAFATWTERPSEASAHDARVLRRSCLDKVGDTVGGQGAPLVASEDLGTRLVDRRGDWVSVLLTWSGPDRYQLTVACIGELPPGSADGPQQVTYSVSGGGGFAAPQGQELIEGPMSEFAVGGGLLGLGRSEQASTTSGEVGPEVVGVTIHAGGTGVEASVQDGTYAAWWPGRLFDPATSDAPAGRAAPSRSSATTSPCVTAPCSATSHLCIPPPEFEGRRGCQAPHPGLRSVLCTGRSTPPGRRFPPSPRGRAGF